MLLKNEIEFRIEREEALELLKVWDRTDITGMRLFGDFNSYLQVGNILRKLKKDSKCRYVDIDVEDYYAFSVNIITNINLVTKDIDCSIGHRNFTVPRVKRNKTTKYRTIRRKI